MTFFLVRVSWLVMLLTLSAPAQLLPQLGNATAPLAAQAQDPLGRDTPSGTVFGFLQAAQSQNYAVAAQFLQMSAPKRQTQGVELATQLKVVLDRAYAGSVRRISSLPEGNPQEGVAPDRQEIGVLSAGDAEANLSLARVTEPSGAKVWLFSADTLSRVPELYEQSEVHQVESHLPGFLVGNQISGLALWQWMAVLLAVPMAAALAWLLVHLIRAPRYLWLRYRKQPGTAVWAAIFTPLWVVFGSAIHIFLITRLRLPLLPRHYYSMTAGVVFIAGASWLGWRVLQQILRRIRQHAVYTGQVGMGSLMLLGERILKAVIFIFAIFAILGTLGFNMTTALAGLGIGGIAIAFAAQKTLENLLGGVSILADEVIRVGDILRVGDKTGTVEDISLRSTRLRTPERVELSIPNGTLATMNVENLSRRDKILFNAKLGLRNETSVDQLRYVLAEIRRLLYEHPKVETEGARARFVAFDSGALIVEVFCFVLTRDGAEFIAIQEDLLLWIMDILVAAGTGLALASQRLYLGRDGGLDLDKTAAAEGQVREWRESGTMPFPDFAARDISQFSNSLPYPRPESSVRKK